MARELPYGPVNVEKFQQIKKYILRRPQAFDMGDWGESRSCGTTACIAGWAVALDDKVCRKRAKLRFHNGSCYPNGDVSLESSINVEEKAVEVLRLKTEGDLSWGFRSRVFNCDLWPEYYRDLYNEACYAGDAKGRAAAAADFIDYVCGLRDEKGNPIATAVEQLTAGEVKVVPEVPVAVTEEVKVAPPVCVTAG